MNALTHQEITTAIVVALGHFLWQGTLLAALAAIAVRQLRTPRGRYAALVVTLGLMAVSPGLTLGVSRLMNPAAIPSPPSAEVVPPGATVEPADSLLSGLESTSGPVANRQMEQAPQIQPTNANPSPANSVASVTPVAPAVAPIATPDSKWSWLIPAILSLYLLGVAGMLLRLAAGLWGGRQLRNQSVPVDALPLQEAVRRQALALGLKFVPVLAYCERVAVPTVIGVLKPTILLPLSLMSGLAADQVEAILAHELAHIRRYDHLVNLLQRMLESLLFFHPAVWWVSQRIRIEREHCCDDLAVACGAVPLNYAASLLRIAELSREQKLHPSIASVSLCATGRMSTLRQRIARLLSDSSGPQVRLAHSLFAFGLGATGCALAWIATSFLWEKTVTAKTETEPAVAMKRVVVEWSAAIGDEVLQEIRNLKKSGPPNATIAGGTTETIRCSAGEIQAILKLHLDRPLQVIVDRSRFTTITLSKQQRFPIVSLHNVASVQKDNEFHDVSWQAEGPLRLASEKETNRLQVNMKLEFGSDSLPRNHADFKFDGRVDEGDVAACLLTQPPGKGWRPALLVVSEVAAVPVSDLKHFETNAKLRDWIEFGPAGMKERASRATAWKARTTRHLAELNPGWTRELPQGGRVQLVGIGRPRQAPMLWWTPAGEPLAGVGARNIPDLDVAAIIRVWETGTRRNQSRPPSPGVRLLGGIPDDLDRVESDAVEERLGAQLFIVPAVITDANGRPALRIGAGFGGWTAETQLGAARDSTATLQDTPFRTASTWTNKFTEKKPRSITSFYWTPTRNFEFAIAAVNKKGETFATTSEPIVSANEPSNSTNHGTAFEHPLPAEEIDHFLIKSRPCHWAEFAGFAIEPVEGLAAPAGAPGKPAAVKLPNGIGVELVGVAKNTAPARAGWQADGSPVGEIPEWPLSFVVSGNNMTTEIDSKKSPPDSNARDALFQFSGTCENPSFRFLNDLNGTAHSNRQKGTIRIRATGKIAADASQGKVGLLLTDEPWGKVQQVSADGTLLNKIEKSDPYWASYQSIQILPRGKTILKKGPPFGLLMIMRRPVDALERYALEVNVIDLQGKTHSAIPWKSGGAADGSHVDESFWGPDETFLTNDFARFEYRLRPFRHRVTFDNVAMEAGKKTTVQASVKTLEEPQPDGPAVGKLPNGISVELFGITKNAASTRSAWRPNGSIAAETGDWPRGMTISGNNVGLSENAERFPPDADARDLLLQIGGLRAYPSLSLPNFGTYMHPKANETIRLRASGRIKKQATEETVVVALTDEPWGTYQQVGLDGTLLNKIEKSDAWWASYQTIQILPRGDAIMKDGPPSGQMLIMRWPTKALEQYAFEIRGIDHQGKSHSVLNWLTRQPQGPNVQESLWGPADKLPIKDLVRFEYRLRPFRHRVTFENVAMEAGHKSAVRVSVKTLEEPHAEDPAVTKRRMIPWLRTLADGTPNEKAQATIEIQLWALEQRPESVDPLLIKSLVRRLSDTTWGTAQPPNQGKTGQAVADWCKAPLIQIGRPAATELIAATQQGSDLARGRATECLGAIKGIGPEGIDALIALLGHSNYEVSGKAFRALENQKDEPTVVAKLIAVSENGSPKAKSLAVGILGAFPGEAVDAVLEKALASPEKQVKLWAAYTMQQHPRPKLAKALVAQFKTDDREIRDQSRLTLTRMAKSVVTELLAGMDSDDARVRAQCAQALQGAFAEATEPRLVAPLTKALLDRDAKVRGDVMYTVMLNVKYFDRILVCDALLINLQHTDPEVRARAATVIAHIRNNWPKEPRLVPPLLKALNDTDAAVVEAAVDALAVYREPLAVPRLLILAKEPNRVGEHAVRALGEIGDASNLAVLRKLAAEGQASALESLGKLQDRESVPLLIESLKHEKPAVRTGAARALAEMIDPRATPALIAALNREVPEKGFVRRSSEWNNAVISISSALGASGDPQAVAALVSRIDAAGESHFIGSGRARSTEGRDPETDLHGHPFSSPLHVAGEAALPELVKGLSLPSMLTQRLCAFVLSNQYCDEYANAGDSSAYRPALLAALNDRDPLVRLFVIKAVGRLKFAEAEPLLLELLDKPFPANPLQKDFWNAELTNPESRLRIEILLALGNFRSDRVREALIRTLKDPDPKVRATAAGSLAWFGPKAALPLTKLLHDDSQVASEAARSLGNIGDPQAIAPLITLLKSNSSLPRHIPTARSLGMLGATDAIPDLKEILRRIPADAADAEMYELQLAAAVSLVQLQDTAGTDRLRQLLQSQDQQKVANVASTLQTTAYIGNWRPRAQLTHEPTRAMIRELADKISDSRTRHSLIEALVPQLDKATREYLERIVRKPQDEEHWHAVRTLAAANPVPYEEQLLKLCENRVYWYRMELVPHLAGIPGPRVLNRLLEMTTDPHLEVREAVIIALSKRPEPAATARLTELATSDPHSRIRLRAAQLLAARKARDEKKAASPASK